MTTPLLPQAFWFRLAVPCPRLDNIPRKTGKRLLDLPESCRLPQTALLDGKVPWSEVRVAWNPEGLGIAMETNGGLDDLDWITVNGDRVGVELWIDTRDTRNVSRATRFCHRFEASLVKGRTRSSLLVQVEPKPIPRAVADAPLGNPEDIDARAESTKDGWRMELFLPARTLNGFDPETNRRLGFNYHVHDPFKHGEFLGIGREFPVGENPSLWATLELVETP